MSEQNRLALELDARVAQRTTELALANEDLNRQIGERLRMEEALRSSEARFSALFHGAPMALSLHSLPEGKFVDINVAALKLLGYPREHMINRTTREMGLYADPDLHLREEFFTRMARDGYVGMELGLRRADGRPLRCQLSATRIEIGGMPHYVAGLVDITESKRVELELRESEQKYRTLFDSIDEGFCTIEVLFDQHTKPVDYRFLQINPSFERQTGIKNAVGRRMREIAPQHEEHWFEIYGRIALTGEPMRFENEARQLGRWYDVYAFRVEDPQLRRVGILFNDITERKLAAERLKESEERFRNLTEISSDFYWETDAQHCYTSIEFGEAYVGLRDLSLKLGRARWEIPSQIASPTPDEAGWAAHRAVCDAREPIVDFGFSRMENGKERFYEINGEPRFDAGGGFLGYRGVGRDVTDRKRAEAELRRSQHYLAEAQRLSHIGSWALNAAGFGHWSPELFKIHGLDPGGTAPSIPEYLALVHPEDRQFVVQQIERLLGGAPGFDFTKRIVRPDGAIRRVRCVGIRATTGGTDPEFVGTGMDITEQERAEDELRRLEKQLRLAQRLEAMGTLAGGIAHDFNNILGAVLGFGEAALRGAPQGSRQRRDLEAILAAGERGRSLVDRILAFSRSGVGERSVVHAEAVVREALELIAGKLPANVRIEAELRAGQAAMLGDPTQIHQVLMNLATNALQAMAAGGTLRVQLATLRLEASRLATVGTVPAGELIVLTVSDTGTGIPPEMIGRIFDPFFTTKEVGVGTGLGLSLVHGLVTEAGGGVDVASVPGQGSTFTVYLPRAGDAIETGESAPPDMPRGDRECVLVVDDEEPLVSLATRTLEELGYAPVGFTSSAAALEAFRLNPQRFDAVITDERMPGVSGTALIREVRGMRSAIPVLLMSGYVGGGVASQAREAGADAVLKKPVLARDLATSLARIFQRH